MRPREAGFTILEILVALVVMGVGALGVMAMQTSAIRSNQHARRLDRAFELAQQMIDWDRSRDLTQLPWSSDSDFLPPFTFNETTPSGTALKTSTQLPDVNLDGVWYCRSLTGAQLAPPNANLVRVVATVTFTGDGRDNNCADVAPPPVVARMVTLRSMLEAP